MADTKEKLSHLTISLHWFVGLVIIGLLVIGIYMHENDAYALYPIHKSIGILLFVFILLRVVWRIRQGWPVPASEYKRHEQILSKVVHWVLIVSTVIMPLSGMVMSVAEGRGLAIFSLELLSTNPDPNTPGGVLPLNDTAAFIGEAVHGLVGKIMVITVILHVLGALKHHILDKDGTLKRMLGKTI